MVRRLSLRIWQNSTAQGRLWLERRTILSSEMLSSSHLWRLPLFAIDWQIAKQGGALPNPACGKTNPGIRAGALPWTYLKTYTLKSYLRKCSTKWKTWPEQNVVCTVDKQVTLDMTQKSQKINKPRKCTFRCRIFWKGLVHSCVALVS